MAIGTIFTEIDLDLSKFEKKQRDLLSKMEQVGRQGTEALQLGFQNLGVTSDAVYQQMANVAIKSYERIVTSGKASAAEQVRAQQAMVSQINAINAKIAEGANAHYATLGMKSAASINEQIANVQRAATAQQLIVGKSSEDWMRIEKAKNEQLKTLNKEMTGDHEMSMASMTRAVLRFYAAYYVISAVGGFLKDFFMGGIKAIDDMKVSVVSVAAQITTMQGTTGNVTQNYKDNVKYAEALIPVLQQVDANSFANLSQIQKMNMAMTNQGVILDVNNEKQIESFTALTNAVALFTQGQDKEKQASQEIRSLMSGQVRAGDMVAMQMDALIKKTGEYQNGLKGLVKEGKAHGDTLERMKPYLIGIVAASGDIQKTWMAVSSSLETAWNIIQRGLFKDVYKDLVENGMEAVKWLKANQDDIVATIKTIYETVAFATKAVIAAFVLIATAATYNAIISGGAWEWFVLKYEALAARTVAASSMMAIGFSVFTAAIAGFTIGTLLNKFESIRKAGVRMVYDMVEMWDWFSAKAQIAWEYTKMASVSTTQASQSEVDATTKTGEGKIKAIKEQYEKEKVMKAQWRIDQMKDVTDSEIAKQKALKDAQDKVKTPIVPPGKDPALKDSTKDHMEALKAKMQADKAYYDEQVKTADQVAKLSQRAGQDEYKTIEILYNTKTQALTDYLAKEYLNAAAEVALEAKQATTTKDGVAKRFDAKAVLAAKESAIDAKYFKDYAKLVGERNISIEDANKMTIQTMAHLYKTIDEYSFDSMDYQVQLIKHKYLEDGRWASATIEQRKVLEAAMNAEILQMTTNNELAKHNIMMHYQETVKGPYSTEYMQAFELSLIAQADLEEKRVGESFDRQAWITQKTNEELAKRLDAQANYYMAIGGMEGKATAISLAAIEMRRKLDVVTYGDENAAAKDAAFKKIKLEQDVIAGIGNRFDIEHKFQIDTINNTGKMLDAAMTMYDKDSSEYKKLAEGKKIVQIAELAMNAVKQATIIATNLGLVASNTGVAMSAAGTSIAGASIGVGPTGFATAAAMMALLASVFAAFGIAGGGGSVSAPSAAYGQNTTVLGGTNNQGSESIANSMKLLEDTYTMEDTKLTGIWNSMKDLNANITGLVTSIVRTGSVSGMNMDTSYLKGPGRSAWENSSVQNVLSAGAANLPLIKWINNFLGSLGETIFGGGIERSITGTGIQTGNASIGSLVGGGGIGSQQYAHVTETHKGGWFSSDWTSGSTAYQTLDKNVSDMMDKVFQNMGTTIVELSKGLGADVNAAMSYVFGGGTIDLQGLDAEGISKKLNEYFSAAGDNAVTALFGSLISSYQQVGEGLMQTAARLVVDKAIVLDTLKMIGKAFSGTAMEAIALSESLIKIAGGLDKLTESTNIYYDKFFTDTEKQADRQKMMLESLTQMSLPLPALREGYRYLVEIQDLSTEAGKENYVTLLQLSSTADEYYSALEDVAKAQEDVTQSLRDQRDTITQWLSDINRSTLAPSNSMEAIKGEYARLKGAASGANATAADTSNFLNYAKEYLDYMRKYGGDYQSIYQNVMDDVGGLKNVKDIQIQLAEAQLQAIKDADNAARINAAALLAQQQSQKAADDAARNITTKAAADAEWARAHAEELATAAASAAAVQSAASTDYSYAPWGGDSSGPFALGGFLTNAMGNAFSMGNILPFANGGIYDSPHIFPLANGRTGLMGEADPEAIMPLKRGRDGKLGIASNGGSNGPGGEQIVHIHIHNETDGREVSEIVATYIPRSGTLTEAIRRAVN